MGRETSAPSREASFPFKVLTPPHRSGSISTFRLPLPGFFGHGFASYVDYTTQNAPREVDFRVKRSELGASPWKRSVWSRGGPGYAGWRLWGPGHRRGPYCRRLAPGVEGPSGLAADRSRSSPPLHLGPRRGAGRLGFIQPSRDGDGSLQPSLPDDPPWRPRLPSCSCRRPLQPWVPIASRAAVVLPLQGLMAVELGAQ